MAEAHFVFFGHSVFPFDGAAVTIALQAERAAASMRSMVSGLTWVNLWWRVLAA
jgi:hypothetical protein